MQSATAVPLGQEAESPQPATLLRDPAGARQLALGLCQGYVGSGKVRSMVHPAENKAKQLGSYYTGEAAADFLVRWALRHPANCRRALDPSCGDGVFLRALCQQFDRAGIEPQGRVLGTDVDRPAAEASQQSLCDGFGVDGNAVIEADFFALSGAEVEADVVVGNPPFIRFHRFAGAARARALACAERHGVRLSGLCSSWAPFVVHSAGVLRPGGQLAMVLPLEATSAVYARPVLDFLVSSFAEVTLITFRTPLFPDLNEGTILVLARDRGAGPGILSAMDLGSAADLASVEWDARGSLCGAQACDTQRLARGEYRMVLQHLPAETALLWSRITADPRVHRLGDVANLGIGYVTGGNGFFHLSPDLARTWAIPPRFLARAVVRSRALAGLSFTAADWKAGTPSGCASYLLHVNGASDLPAEVLAYLRHGEAMGVASGYKCRNRTPWYSVPQVLPPDAFLTYMSHDLPRVVANVCGAVAPNTLHCVHLRPGNALDGLSLALLWCNSLTLLSAEIEGHALGGGMLKREPGEARRVLLPQVPESWRSAGPTLDLPALDGMLRDGRQDALRDYVDEAVLGVGLGLAPQDWQMLREGARLLRCRRLHKAA